MTGNAILRRAEVGDLAGASRSHASAFNALNALHGYPDQRYSVCGINPYFRFAIDDAITSFWVAEIAREVRGIGIASVFDHVWFLTHLFVDPIAQGIGLGRRLMERVLDDERLPRANNWALVTMAYNPVSLGLYARYGLQPRSMIYRVEADAQGITGLRPVPSIQEASESDRSDLAPLLGAIDRGCLSLDRPWHHRFFLSCPEARCLVMNRGNGIGGYIYLWDDGRIGPAAAAAAADLRELTSACVDSARRRSIRRISLFVSPDDRESFHRVVDLGMRVTLPFVVMSATPLRPIRNYLYHSPGLL